MHVRAYVRKEVSLTMDSIGLRFGYVVLVALLSLASSTYAQNTTIACRYNATQVAATPQAITRIGKYFIGLSIYHCRHAYSNFRCVCIESI